MKGPSKCGHSLGAVVRGPWRVIEHGVTDRGSWMALCSWECSTLLWIQARHSGIQQHAWMPFPRASTLRS